MAGKLKKGRNRKSSNNAVASSETATSENPIKDNVSSKESAGVDFNGTPAVTDSASVKPEMKRKESAAVDVNRSPAVTDLASAKPEMKDVQAENSADQPKQGDLHLYPVPVKTQNSEKLELQLNPGDSVMDIRQFLLDAPETCYITCYHLLLHTKDGSSHHLEDFNEVAEVADITSGSCSLEMVAAFYDDRSIRVHVHRTRELLSLAALHSSLSTSLALQYEATQNKTTNSGDSVKTEIPELDGLGFMEDITGSLSNLLSSSSKELKCIENLVFSSFNPPPSYRRLVGDLIYLDVVTLEGNKFCISGTTKMFYVNSSTGNTFDPRPSKASYDATTLIGLLQKISSKFKKAFREILEQKASAHPFEIAQCPLRPNSWLSLYPVPDHKRDSARAEDTLTLSFGSELIGMQRDWNGELQSCREFPCTTPQESILRDRALYKVTSDFVEAATSGAIGVINRCIPPINPTDPECFHMYVHNNIFFSFAVDSDLEQLSRKDTSDAYPKSESTKSACVSPVKAYTSSFQVECKNSCEKNDGCSSATDCNGTVDAVNVSSESQPAESEQATYASANNDLKGTKAYQEIDVPGIYNLAMVIIDYRGHRVVAQSVLPGILQGDKSDSLLYGSVDNGKKICWNEDFHSKVLEAAKRLHLKEHSVVDGSGNIFKLAAPVDCKGIVGSDDRHYLLDLMRVTPRDANYMGPGSRFCILRPELITAFCQAKAAERSKSRSKSEEGEAQLAPDSSEVISTSEKEITEGKTEKDQKCDSSLAESLEQSEEILFNPNVFTDFKLSGNLEEISADEENVKKASSFLIDVVLPKFKQDLCTLEVSPMDGQTLTEALHAHGINVRYLGKVASGTKQLPHLWDLCCNEIVVRSAKHIIKNVIRDTEDHDLGPAVAHFFNCFFGNCQAAGAKVDTNSTLSKTPKKEHEGCQSSGKSDRRQARWKNRTTVHKSQPQYMSLSSEILWSDIKEFSDLKYQFELPDDARAQVKKVSVIRNICQKVGITIASRKYDLGSPTPFQTSDIQNLQPVVKHSIPVCSEAKNLVETGKVQLAEGMLSEAYTLFSEAFSLLQQVTGPMHREVANCCRYLAIVLYHAGDMAGAIMQQHKELIINERCLGLDHPDTAHSYGNMALFYHGLNQTELALRHMSRALLLLSLSSGQDHPDVAATFMNVAMMYQDIGKMNIALRYLQEALKKNDRLLGKDHIQTAVCYHALAIAFNCMGAFKLSHQHEKKTYDILVKQLGEEDPRTRDSENWMKTFKMRELQVNAQKQKGQALDAASAQKAIDILKAHPDLMQAFQAAAAGNGSSGAWNSSNKSLNATLIGETLPRGRGVSERAARATAEARKKAAARGLLVRPSGVQAQALPPLTQLLNIINAGTSTHTVENGESSGANKESNGHPLNGAVDGKKDKPAVQKRETQIPAGLGQGLKNRKQNQK